MFRTTCIRNAAWVAACEPASDRHVYRRDIDVAFTLIDEARAHPSGRLDGILYPLSLPHD